MLKKLAHTNFKSVGSRLHALGSATANAVIDL